MIFAKDARARFPKSNPNVKISVANQLKEIGKMWATVTSEQKQKYDTEG
jgi:hypothetical protein